MTTVYFVRHAQPDFRSHDDRTRELSPKGMEDREKVTAFFQNKSIDAVLSSPYKRAVDTIKHFADSRSLSIELVEDFRERKVTDSWIDDFQSFSHYYDPSFGHSDFEALQPLMPLVVKFTFDDLNCIDIEKRCWAPEPSPTGGRWQPEGLTDEGR